MSCGSTVASCPKAVFEVEHSTDIKNSLIKFAELEDFRVETKIVADEHRKREFEQVMGSRVFEAVHRLVGFMSYQQVSEMSESIVVKRFTQLR